MADHISRNIQGKVNGHRCLAMVITKFGLSGILFLVTGSRIEVLSLKKVCLFQKKTNQTEKGNLLLLAS